MTAALPEPQPDPKTSPTVNPTLTPKPARRRTRRDVENPEYIDFTRRIIRRAVERIGRDGDLEGLADLADLQNVIAAAIADSVTELREEHAFPWSEIGRVLGVTRQAAQQKYGTKDGTS